MRFPSLKKWLIWVLFSGAMCLSAACGWLFFTAANLPKVGFLSDPGASVELKVPNWQGEYFPFTVGPQNPDWVPLHRISRDFRNAVLAGEDFSFYSHHGIDWFELKESLIKDLKERHLARGASTITQQLAKNLFLSREKTIVRKIRELILARGLEKTLSKERILELYLNVVELGDNVYGVEAGARYHFGKKPSELSLRESAFLAAMLPGPKVYDPYRNMDRVMNRSNHLLGVMLKGRMITDDQYLAALTEDPFSKQPFDTGNVEQFPETAVESSPPFEDKSMPGVQQTPAAVESATEDEELLTTRDGIIEIPIQ